MRKLLWMVAIVVLGAGTLASVAHAQVDQGMRELNTSFFFENTKSNVESGKVSFWRAQLAYNYFFSGAATLGFAGALEYVDLGGTDLREDALFGDLTATLGYHFNTHQSVVPYVDIRTGWSINANSSDGWLIGTSLGFKSFVRESAAAITVAPYYMFELTKDTGFNNFGLTLGVSVFF